MARPRLTPLDYIQGYAACDKDAVGSAASECEYNRLDFCFARRMVTMSTQSLPSRILVLFHCFIVTIFGALHVLGRRDGLIRKLHRDWGDVGADWG